MAMMTKIVHATVVAVLSATSLALAGAALSQPKGGYTEAQVARGGKTFATSCGLCHGESLGGGPGTPPLKGPEFLFTWKDKNAAELFDYVKANMPPGQAGSLTDQQYADMVAVILKGNEVPAGEAELTADPAVQKSIRIAAP